MFRFFLIVKILLYATDEIILLRYLSFVLQYETLNKLVSDLETLTASSALVISRSVQKCSLRYPCDTICSFL